MLLAELWSHNSHTLRNDLLPAIEIFKKWPEQYRKYRGRPSGDEDSPER